MVFEATDLKHCVLEPWFETYRQNRFHPVTKPSRHDLKRQTEPRKSAVSGLKISSRIVTYNFDWSLLKVGFGRP